MKYCFSIDIVMCISMIVTGCAMSSRDHNLSIIRTETDQAPWFRAHAIHKFNAKFNHHRVKVYHFYMFKSCQFKHLSEFKAFKTKKM